MAFLKAIAVVRLGNSGRVILAAQIARTGADFGVMSGGGIRDSIEAGDITYKSVLKGTAVRQHGGNMI